MSQQNVKNKADFVAEPIIIYSHELPLCCPRPGVPVWNLHPKVYLPIDKTGQEKCPYCSATYLLETSE